MDKSDKSDKSDKPSLVQRAPVHYYPNFLDEDTANKLLEELHGLDIGRHTYNNKKLARNTAVFGDSSKLDEFPEIWGQDTELVDWTPVMKIVLDKLRSFLGQDFNICLVNKYCSGKDFIGWHADNEEKGDKYCIASISLGAVRQFEFLLKTKELEPSIKPSIKSNTELGAQLGAQLSERASIQLGHGSLLVMSHPCQDLYLHRLPPDKKVKDERINLTFRIFHY
jgi:alkylated DNA repair dioxygenase AlkB